MDVPDTLSKLRPFLPSISFILSLPVLEGEIAPAFGQPGGGVQILPNVGTRVNVQWLLDNDYIVRVEKR